MRKPTKIAWISSVGEKGGAEVVMIGTIAHLDREKFSPSVFLLRPGPLEAELRGMGIPVYMMRPHRMRHVLAVWRCILAIKRTIRAEGIRLVHSNAFRAHVYGGLAARLVGVPEVWTVHAVEKEGLFTRLILRIPSTAVIANCPRTADYFSAHGHPNEVIWPGIDRARLERRTPRATLAHRFNLPVSARWVSMAARLQRYKGQLYFVRALASLPKGEPPVHGIVIGASLFGMETDFLGELKAESCRLGVADRVHFTGFIPDEEVAGLLDASDLVVHPALDEDFGISVAEAQMLGKPVVAFAATGPSHIILDGQTGRLVPVGDQTALNQAVATALGDPDTSKRWGQAGHARAIEQFAVEIQARKTAAIYDRCLAPR